MAKNLTEVVWNGIGRHYYFPGHGYTSYDNFCDCIVQNTIRFFAEREIAPTKHMVWLFGECIYVLWNEKADSNTVMSAMDFIHSDDYI